MGLVRIPGRKRKRTATTGQGSSRGGSGGDEPGEGGPDEAAAFIAEQAKSLRVLAGRHKLAVLHYLLGMTQVEAEEHVRLRSKRKLS